MNDSRKSEFGTEMTDKQRTDIRRETPRGAKTGGDSSAGFVDPGGWTGVDYDKKDDEKWVLLKRRSWQC